MGEQADYLTDSMWDLPEEDGDEEDSLGPALKTCRCCGARDLHWAQVGDKWRLFHEDDGVHVCPVRPLPQTKP